MNAVLIISAIAILLSAGVAWRLATERARPDLPDYSSVDPSKPPHSTSVASKDQHSHG
jgi:hypothetical protein